MSTEAKPKLQTDLENMAPEQFAQVKGLVEAEHMRRDNGASEAEFRRKVSAMTNNELEEWKRQNGM